MDEAVKQVYDAWGNRASLQEPEAVVNGERLFKVGGYSITVSANPEEPAKVASLYNRWGARENPMPNMSFSDGEMRIPIEDFVDLILRRVPAEELAEGLWRDDSVRERFVYCMANRYAGPIEDEDRRKVLDKIQVEIHAKAVDRAIERLNNIESDLRAKTNRSRWEQAQLGHYTLVYDMYTRAITKLEELSKPDADAVRSYTLLTTPEQLKRFIDEAIDPVTRESAGEQWRESRDFWRRKLEDAFPEPVALPEPTP